MLQDKLKENVAHLTGPSGMLFPTVVLTELGNNDQYRQSVISTNIFIRESSNHFFPKPAMHVED